MQLEGHSAIVTGGASGLGAETARQLSANGVTRRSWRGTDLCELRGHRAGGKNCGKKRATGLKRIRKGNECQSGRHIQHHASRRRRHVGARATR